MTYTNKFLGRAELRVWARARWEAAAGLPNRQSAASFTVTDVAAHFHLGTPLSLTRLSGMLCTIANPSDVVEPWLERVGRDGKKTIWCYRDTLARAGFKPAPNYALPNPTMMDLEQKVRAAHAAKLAATVEPVLSDKSVADEKARVWVDALPGQPPINEQWNTPSGKALRWAVAGLVPVMDELIKTISEQTAATVLKAVTPELAALRRQLDEAPTLTEIAACVANDLTALEHRLLTAFGGAPTPADPPPEASDGPQSAPTGKTDPEVASDDETDASTLPRVLIYRLSAERAARVTARLGDRLRLTINTDFSGGNQHAKRWAARRWDAVVLMTRHIGHAERAAFEAAGHELIFVTGGVDELLTTLERRCALLGVIHRQEDFIRRRS